MTVEEAMPDPATYALTPLALPTDMSPRYKERDVLLQDIVSRMDNWKELADEEKAKKRARNRGIETSGELMRRLATGEMDQMDDDEEEEKGDDGGVSAAVGGDSTTQQSDDSACRHCSGEAPVFGRKRAATSGARRVQKVSSVRN
ncbi:hypothetical protein PInf_009971 [Phytophthora infestans]|nr:hypothetical protein PInf_009971 [Phytophthora infestans]